MIIASDCIHFMVRLFVVELCILIINVFDVFADYIIFYTFSSFTAFNLSVSHVTVHFESSD